MKTFMIDKNDKVCPLPHLLGELHSLYCNTTRFKLGANPISLRIIYTAKIDLLGIYKAYFIYNL